MGTVGPQRRRQLDRVDGNGPYHCRRGRRGKFRHRHCVAVNRISNSRVKQISRCTVALFPVGDTELFARQRSDSTSV